MIVSLPGGDVTWEVSETPKTTPLRASIDVFAASLADAHPYILSRSPVCDSEDIAALLQMSLDQCRHLLAAYEALVADQGDDETPADGDDFPF